MAYGKIKADAFIYDDGGSDTEITAATIASNSNKAPTASPTFTGTVTLPATTALAGQASDVTIIDNNAAALEVKEGSNTYVTFDTTNSAEQIEVAKPVVTTSNITINATNELRLADSDSSHYVAIKAPDTVSSNVTLKLPSTDGNADQVLKTNGSGVLDWVDAASGKLGKVTCLESHTRTSVSVTPSGSAFSVVNILGMGNFTKATDTSALYIWGMSQGHGQQSGGGGFTIQVGSTLLDQAGNMTYPGGNYAVAINWAGKVAAGGMNAGTYAITLGHRSNASNKPISIINPDSTSNDHNAYPPSSNNGTGTVIFVMEVEP